MEYKVNQLAVYGAHGMVTVRAIVSRIIGRKAKKFYVLNVVNRPMTIMVPCDDTSQMRPLVNKEKANEVMDFMTNGAVKVEETTWNRRYREFIEKIKTGDIDQIAYVYVALTTLRKTKDLSFGERKMIDEAYGRLTEELSAVIAWGHGSTKDSTVTKNSTDASGHDSGESSG